MVYMHPIKEKLKTKLSLGKEQKQKRKNRKIKTTIVLLRKERLLKSTCFTSIR